VQTCALPIYLLGLNYLLKVDVNFIVTWSPVVIVPNIAVGGSTLYSLILRALLPVNVILSPATFASKVMSIGLEFPAIVKVPLVVILQLPADTQSILFTLFSL